MQDDGHVELAALEAVGGVHGDVGEIVAEGGADGTGLVAVSGADGEGL